jgi:hypothetical protein
MLEAGTYFGTVKSAVTSEAKTGTPQLVLAVAMTQFLDTSQNAWVELPSAMERKVFLSLSDNAWEYTEKKLKALGFNGDFIAPQFSTDATENGVQWLCRIEEYQGKPGEKWDLANWGGEVQQAGQDVLRRLNAKFAASNRPQASRPAGRPTPPPSRPAAPARQAAPSRPAPAPAASATATLEITDKDSAWASYCDSSKGEPDLEAWNSAVSGHMAAVGKTEEQFTAEDWQAALAAAEIPF